MDKFAFLKTLTLEQLISLKDATNDENLIKNIMNILGEDKTKYFSSFYSSDRTKYINPDMDDEYKRIIASLKINALDFYSDLVCKGKGNNKGINSSYSYLSPTMLIYDYPNVKELLEYYKTNKLSRFHHLYNALNDELASNADRDLSSKLRQESIIIKAEEETSYFKYLDEFFKNDQNKALYEGAYNSYMYIKEHIFKRLSESKNLTLKQLLAEYEEKILLTTEYLQEICTYILEIRTRVPAARISAANNQLKSAARRKYNKLNEMQLQFAELLAFGASKEDIEDKNFEDYERLIYIPRKH